MMKKVSNGKSAKKKQVEIKRRRFLLVFIFPLFAFILFLTYYEHQLEEKQNNQIADIPPEYIPIYKAAEEEYGVPWFLLAAHHRVETIFSTMDPMVSPAGAEGHMQFMPCTFVGWKHPTCGGLGRGNIPKEELIDPKTIEKYGGFGVDANGDGIADPWDIEDAIFSAANYLSHNGAASGNIREAVFAYNHSEAYVEEVLYFAKQYEES